MRKKIPNAQSILNPFIICRIPRGFLEKYIERDLSNGINSTDIKKT